jgi:hypothetical protein
MKSTDIKKIFKSLGINVLVHTVKCKNPFTQIWTEDDSVTFPNDIRKIALVVYYNLPDNDISSLNVLNHDEINYGNI